MPTHTIAVIAGDGIGPEVIDQAVHVADAAVFSTGEAVIAWDHLPWNSEQYLKTGTMMPADGMARLRGCQALLVGAVGHPKVKDHVTLRGLLLPIRREFDQFINLRPVYLFDGVRSPLADKKPGSIDIVVFRENTEGEYCDVGGRVYEGGDHEVVVQTSVFTRRGTERIIRAAFEYAKTKRRRKHLTSITKSNAQQYSMVFWDEVFEEVATEYPEVKTRKLLVDAAAMELIRRPESFDVVVASNLFGDILTEITAVITGSIGLAASANINPDKRVPSMFEPIHGSAPDIAGKSSANPLASILAVALMFEHLELVKSAQLVRAAVAQVLRERTALTPDLGGSATTVQTADAVLQQIKRC